MLSSFVIIIIIISSSSIYHNIIRLEVGSPAAHPQTKSVASKHIWLHDYVCVCIYIYIWCVCMCMYVCIYIYIYTYMMIILMKITITIVSNSNDNNTRGDWSELFQGWISPDKKNGAAQALWLTIPASLGGQQKIAGRACLCQRKKKCSSGGSAIYDTFRSSVKFMLVKCPSGQWQPDGSTIHKTSGP